MDRINRLYRTYFGTDSESVTPLPISGSARRYFRLNGPKGSAIACIGSSSAENRAFLSIARAMRLQGINVPLVYAVSEDSMTYLQEDLGDGQLFSLLKPFLGTKKETGIQPPGNASLKISGQVRDAALPRNGFGEEQLGWLRATVAALPRLQLRTGRVLDWSVCYPDSEMNLRMVRFDLNYFKYDFLKLTTLPFDEIKLQDDFDRLGEDALRPFGNCFMYRDFQARNVIIRDGEPWFVDFQGGRRGPGQYDLASFLWNAGTLLDGGLRAELEGIYLDALRDENGPVDEGPWRESYRTLTLLRLLQEAGAYGYRGLVERKELFLDCIPGVLEQFRELLKEPFPQYPYLSALLYGLATQWDGKTRIPGLEIKL